MALAYFETLGPEMVSKSPCSIGQNLGIPVKENINGILFRTGNPDERYDEK